MSLCSFIISRGKNKGKECGKKCKENFCSIHLKKKEKTEEKDKNEDIKSGCNHIFISGKNKGKLCGKKNYNDSQFCSLHQTNKKKTDEFSLKVEHIELFYKKSDSRKENGSDNRIREDILSNFEHKNCRKFYQDQTYGKKWRELKDKFYALFDSIPQIEKTAGMNNDFDFLINGNRFEFKFNATSVFKLPQHVQLRTNNSGIIEKSYAEYYYENHLSEVCSELKIEKPNKEDYLNNVHKHECKNIVFFDFLKKGMNAYAKRRVKESIDEFLEKNCKNINLEYLKNRLALSLHKTFIMYDLKTHSFILEDVSDDFSSLSIKEIKNKNTVVLSTNKYKYELLLRWKNGIGILNPAWQIKIKN